MVNIVLCADESYAPYGAVVIMSAIINTSEPKNLAFYWLTPGLSADTKARLITMVEALGAQLHIIEVEDELAGEIDMGRFGMATLLRLCMHRYLPESCDKAIYLDCDVLVLSDLEELWGLPLEGNVIGAALDLCTPSNLGSREDFENYFNAGVLLIDVGKWKSSSVGERALSCFSGKGGALKYHDQDALNIILKGQWQKIPLSWNFQPTAYAATEKRYDHLRGYFPELREAIRRPHIVHFIGANKPWHPHCLHPLQDDFIEYSNKTGWPINIIEKKKQLPFKKRLRIALKKYKSRRRRRMTELN